MSNLNPDTPAESSVSFVLSRPDDETLVFSIEFDGQEPGEEMTRATYGEVGWAGISMLETAVEKSAVAIGAKVVHVAIGAKVVHVAIGGKVVHR